MDLNKMENILTKDLIDKIYSMIVYTQPNNLLLQIQNFNYKKDNITLCYNYIIQHWNHYFLDALDIFWKLHYICNTQNACILWHNNSHIDYCLINYKNYISIEQYNIYNSELIRVLNIKNFMQKKLAIKKYIIKYMLVLKKYQIDYIINHMAIWGFIDYNFNERIIDEDHSLNCLTVEVIQDAYIYEAPNITLNDL